MKKQFNLFLLFLATMPFSMIAQNTEGQIFYKETIQLNIELPPEVAEQMKGKMPTERSSDMVLYFNETTSLFKNADQSDKGEETIEESMEGEDGGIQIKMRIDTPDNRTYKDLENGKKIQQREFMGKKFLIKDELIKYQWKMAGEQKQIGDYMCMKATHVGEKDTIVAWFTPQIPVAVGPNNLGQLPGAILEVDFNHGEQTIVMTSVQLKTLDKDSIVAPKKGKEVTEAEMDDIIEKKMKEMGGQGGTVIRRRTN